MHPALTGGIVGIVIALLLVAVEYMSVKKQVEGRTSPSNPKPKFEAEDRNRIRAVVNFCLFLPPAFALGFWLVD